MRYFVATKVLSITYRSDNIKNILRNITYSFNWNVASFLYYKYWFVRNLVTTKVFFTTYRSENIRNIFWNIIRYYSFNWSLECSISPPYTASLTLYHPKCKEYVQGVPQEVWLFWEMIQNIMKEQLLTETSLTWKPTSYRLAQKYSSMDCSLFYAGKNWLGESMRSIEQYNFTTYLWPIVKEMII